MFGRFVFCMVIAGCLLAQEQPAANGTSLQISGVLVDAVTGQPIRQARVAIAPVANRDALTTIVTGENGRFLFSNLTTGKYGLTAQRHGYLTRSFNQHDQYSSSIVVGPDQDSSSLIFRLPPECAISGKVSDEAGEPVGSAQVILYQTGTAGGEQGPRLRQRRVADDEGFYHFGHLPSGKYLIAVVGSPWYAQRPAAQEETYSIFRDGGFNRPGSDPGTYLEEQGRSPLDVAYPITFYPGVTEANAATTIVIRDGERFVADITLQPVQALRIRVPADDKGGSSKTDFLHLQVRLFDGSPVNVSAETRVLSSGDLDIVGLAPGHYEATILDHHGDTRAVTRSGEMEALASGDINLQHETAPVAVTANVQLDASAPAPLQGYLQLYNSKTREAVSEQVSAEGEVEFKRTIQPGTYEVSVNNNRGEFIKAISATGATVSGRTLEVKGSGHLTLAVTIARGQGQIRGVALRDGKPVAGAMIVLVPSDPGHNQILFRRDQSDSDGSFTLPVVVPGKYTLLALANGWDLEWLNPAVLKPYLPGGESLQIQQDGKYDVKVKVQ